MLKEQFARLGPQGAQKDPAREDDFDPGLPDCPDSSPELADESPLKIVFQRLSPTATNNLISLCMEGENLTVQEQKVLALIVKGLTNKEIAKELHVEPATVKAHLKNAFQKLKVMTRSQAISYLLLKGLLKNTKSTTLG